jgi:short-subunit dehydrogenase
VVGEIEAMQGKALGVATDVSDRRRSKRCSRKPRRRSAGFDVLFNNAGFGAAGLIEDLEWESGWA